MNFLGYLFLFMMLLSIGVGWGARFVYTKFKLRGATLMVELERSTGDLVLDWRKPTRNWYTLKRPHGEADVPLAQEARLQARFARRDLVTKTNADGTTTATVVESQGYNPWGNRKTGLRAFLIDSAKGLPLMWQDPKPTGDGQAPVHLLDGYTLNRIRKDIRVKSIQANNGVDMAAIAKVLLAGLALVLLVVLFIAWKMG